LLLDGDFKPVTKKCNGGYGCNCQNDRQKEQQQVAIF